MIIMIIMIIVTLIKNDDNNNNCNNNNNNDNRIFWFLSYLLPVNRDFYYSNLGTDIFYWFDWHTKSPVNHSSTVGLSEW